MILKFTQDYSGRETAMHEYKSGEQADIPNAQALALVRLGVAREMWASVGAMYDPPKVEPITFSPAVGDVEITPLPEPEPAKAKKPRKGKGKTK
jgi:hypothetical protein